MRPFLVAWLLRHGIPGWFAPDYGTMVGLATLIGAVLILRLAKRDRADVREQAFALLLTYIACLLGGYVFEWARAVPAAIATRSWLPILGAGRAAYGGLLGGLIVAPLWLRFRKQAVRPFLDRATLGMGIEFAFVRMGCYLEGCDYGKPTASAFGVRFPAGSLAATDHVARGFIPQGAPSLPVHPTELYEGLAGMLATVLAYRRLARGERTGAAFVTWLATYAGGRFAVELLRDDAGRGFLLGLSTAQWVSVGLFALCVFLAKKWGLFTGRTASTSTGGTGGQGGPPGGGGGAATAARASTAAGALVVVLGASLFAFEPDARAQDAQPQAPAGTIVSPPPPPPSGTLVPSPTVNSPPPPPPTSPPPPPPPSGSLVPAPSNPAGAPSPPNANTQGGPNAGVSVGVGAHVDPDKTKEEKDKEEKDKEENESDLPLQRDTFVGAKLLLGPSFPLARPDVPASIFLGLDARLRFKFNEKRRGELGLEYKHYFQGCCGSRDLIGLPFAYEIELTRRFEIELLGAITYNWFSFSSPVFQHTTVTAWGLHGHVGATVALWKNAAVGFSPLALDGVAAESIGVIVSYEIPFWLTVAF